MYRYWLVCISTRTTNDPCAEIFDACTNVSKEIEYNDQIIIWVSIVDATLFACPRGAYQ